MGHKLSTVFTALLFVTAAAFGQTLPPGVAKKASLGGVSEYDYPNGLRVLLYPDPASPKVTINMTYLVGSRHEGYGETGMAHLLEHMNFIETTSGRQIKKEIVDRGASWNGSTSEDRTNYYETVPATDANLQWALGLEADRMVNVKMAKPLLDTEMTVVRNEFERGENNPRNVLAERVEATAYLWHNYGKSTIGSREDIERVPIERLAAFYRKFYQPDNAVLVIAGRLDESKALAFVADTVGKIPRPARQLDQTYTVEPPQDGERFVELRRVGEGKEVMLAYHGPSSGQPDSAALQVLSAIMTGAGGGRGGGQGRLSKALVDTKKANAVSMAFGLEHDPGLIELSATLSKDQAQDEVRKVMIDTLEGVIAEPPSSDEVERGKTRLVRNLENQMSDPQTFGLRLSEPIAQGDWRLVFLQHDRLKQVTAADIVRVAKLYLKASNRTVGYFTPDPNPDRTVVPDSPNLEAVFKDFKSDVTISRGEAFDPKPANIEARVERSKLANGMKVALLNKQSPNSMVSAVIELNFGDQQTLAGGNAAAQLAGSLLMRGTRSHSRQQIQDEMDKLNARINVSGGGGPAGGGRGGRGGGGGGALSSASATVEAPSNNIIAALRLAVEILREPAYPASDFDQMKTQRVRTLENVPTEPAQLAQEALQRHLTPFAKGDVLYPLTREEQLADMQRVTLDDVRRFHDQFYGASHGVMAIVGPFDKTAILKFAQESLGSWSVSGPYQRIYGNYKPAARLNQKIETPDKANAQFEAGLRIPMSQDDPDYPAMVLANYMLGGSITARVPNRIRNREGLSYSVSTSFTAPAEGNSAMLSAVAISNPVNSPKVEMSFTDELAKTLQGGFTPEEVATAKKAYADAQTVSRSQDGALVSLLAAREQFSRTLLWDEQLDAKIQALTPEQISAAFRKHVDAAAVSVVKAGDFKAAGVYQ